jgi:O-antigen ligase
MTASQSPTLQAAAYRPIVTPAYDAAFRPRAANRGYLILAGLAVATGSVVLVEPAPYDLAIILLFVAGVLLRRLSFTREHRLPVLLLTGFLCANAISMCAAPDLRVAAGHVCVTTYLVVSWLLFVGLSGSGGQFGVRALMNGYAAAAWFSALAAGLAFFDLIPYREVLLRFGRAQGLFKDPNVYGPYLVPVLLYGLMRLQRVRPFSLRFFGELLACALIATGVFISFSRAAWGDCALATVAFLGLQFAYSVRTRTLSAGALYSVLALVLIVGIVAALSLAGGSGFSHLLQDRLGDNGLHHYDDDRFDTQRRAIETVLQQPMGIGPGQSEVVFDYSTHNMYLRILVESGVLGFVAFYAFVLLSVARATRLALTLRDRFTRDVFALVSASCFGLLLNGFVIDTVHWRHLWFLLALAWWTPRLTRENPAAQAPVDPA